MPVAPLTRAARRRDQRVRRKKQQILVGAPHLEDAFRPLLESLARVTLLTEDGYEFLRKNGLVNEQGELRSSVDTVQRLMSTQLKLANALGLSPAALGKLRKEKPADLAAALAGHVDVEDAEEVGGGVDGSQ